MYYILSCPSLLNENGEALTELHNYFEVGDVWDWTDGRPLEDDERGFDTPIKIDFDPLNGYQGPPPEFDDLGIPLMSLRLKEALDKSGADNIEYFPAVVTDTDTGKQYDYFVFKLVGRVAITNLDESEYESYDEKVAADASIYDLVIDEEKADGLLIFRLAEDITAIMVNEQIKNAVEEAGIDTIQFLMPEKYVRI